MPFTIHIEGQELFDETRNRFIPIASKDLVIEHSLVSISKWEAKWCKSFLDTSEKTYEELIDYIKCMTLTQHVDPYLYYLIDQKTFDSILNYIRSPMTATTFTKDSKGGAKEIITSEIIYYWMFSYGIPMECQKWHLNRLLTLIRVFDKKNQPQKKMSKTDVQRQNTDLNAIRRAQMKTRG